MEPTIRTATIDDTQALLDYYELLLAEKLPGIFERPLPSFDEEAAFVRKHTEADNAELFVAEDDGRIVGVLGVAGGSFAQEAHSAEIGISILGGYRGQGLGTRLFDELFAWAPEHGVTRLQLYAFANNPSAIALYRRLGFEDEGVLREAVMVDGEPVDVLLLAKLLPRG